MRNFFTTATPKMATLCLLAGAAAASNHTNTTDSPAAASPRDNITVIILLGIAAALVLILCGLTARICFQQGCDCSDDDKQTTTQSTHAAHQSV